MDIYSLKALRRMNTAIDRRDLLKSRALALGFAGLAGGQETAPVGKTTADQALNAELLSGYDYKKYASSLTGYTGQDLQRVVFLHYEHAVRVRVGPRGNFEVGMARPPKGKLPIAVCRNNNDLTPPKGNSAPGSTSTAPFATTRSLATLPSPSFTPNLILQERSPCVTHLPGESMRLLIGRLRRTLGRRLESTHPELPGANSDEAGSAQSSRWDGVGL